MPDRTVQTSFAGGELAPSLYARVDLAKYRVGAKLLKNFYVRPHGGVVNRPGFQYICNVKNHDHSPALIPFEASANDTYVLEFGNLYIRVIRFGVPVVYPIGHPSAGQIVEITSPYLIADVQQLHFEQSNDVLTITHQLYQPRELARLDHHNWAFTLLDFQPSIAAPTGVNGSATTGYSGTDYFATSESYTVTAVNAEGEESLATGQASMSNDLNYKPNFNTITWNAVSGAVSYNVFKARSGVYGYIGSTPNLTFRDDNISPSLADSPQVGNNPFSGSGNWPRTVSFFQQRRVMAGTVNKPSGVFMSQSGSYRNMSVSSPVKDNDAIIFAVAARSLQQVLHMVSVEDLILLTPSTEFKVTGGSDEVLTPSSVQARPQSYYGSADIRPLVIGSQIVFVQAKGQTVRDIGYKFEQNRYTGDDLTILASHLFVGRTIVDWALAKAPSSLVWTVLSDGNFLTLTYMREHEIWAWSRHQTDGYVEQVVTVSEGSEDAVYIVVRRYINGAFKRYIERLHTREILDIRDAFFVDSGLSLNNPVAITDVTRANPAVFESENHNLSNGDEVEAYSTVYGPNNEELPQRSYTIQAVTTDTFQLVEENSGLPVDTSAWPAFTFSGIFRKKFGTLGGLDHLEGKRVVALVDGNVVGVDDEVITVSGGSITLPFKGARIHAGLPYDCDLETLDMEPGQSTAQGVIRSVPKVTVKVEGTRGLAAGPDFDRLIEYKTREFEDYGQPNAPITDDLEVHIEPHWDRHGSVCLRQRYPLPATVLSHIPQIEYGD